MKKTIGEIIKEIRKQNNLTMDEQMRNVILIPNSKTTRITRHTLSPNYNNLKISNLGFIE